MKAPQAGQQEDAPLHAMLSPPGRTATRMSGRHHRRANLRGPAFADGIR
jgi:hypothetical protein